MNAIGFSILDHAKRLRNSGNPSEIEKKVRRIPRFQMAVAIGGSKNVQSALSSEGCRLQTCGERMAREKALAA